MSVYRRIQEWLSSLTAPVHPTQMPQLPPTSGSTGVQSPVTEADRFAAAVFAAMQRMRADKIAIGYNVHNLFYIRGWGMDHRPNGNPFNNRFNDYCGFLRVLPERLKPSIIGEWPCTVDPGKQYVYRRLNKDGAAAIKPGYYEAWHVDYHPMSRPNHEALVQSAGDVTVYSDGNEDGSTDGDKTRTGRFGINQHGPGTGYGDQLLMDIGPVSAGCLVVPSMPMHRARMSIAKADARYLQNPRHVFGTFIFDAKDIWLSQS
jgi:hypothetical protein